MFQRNFFEYFLIDWQMWRTRREAKFTGVRKHEVVIWLLISTEMGTLSAVCQKVQLKYFLSSLCLEIQKTYKLRAVTMLYWFAACVAWYTDTRNKQKEFQFHDQTQERGDKRVTGTFLHKLLSLLPLSPASQWPICWPTDMIRSLDGCMRSPSLQPVKTQGENSERDVVSMLQCFLFHFHVFPVFEANSNKHTYQMEALES